MDEHVQREGGIFQYVHADLESMLVKHNHANIDSPDYVAVE